MYLITVFSASLNALESAAAHIYQKKRKKKEAGQPAEPLWLHTQHVGIEREQLRFIAIT